MTRRPPLSNLARDRYDLVIIGGGITGAGVARDAALRGLRVALFEQGDFGSGTSSRTSRLIHGGIRYLEQGHLGLVFEASRERRILMRIAPHLVRPLAFLFPVYRGDPWGRLGIQAGMLLYDLLALFQNVRPHRMLNPSQVLEMEPGLNPKGLSGAACYYDCLMDDARLCLANILDARAHGAAVRNYTRVIGLIRSGGGRIAGVRLEDRITNETATVWSEIVVNAAGPWVDEVCRLEDPSAPSRLTRILGAHLVVPRLTRGQAVVARNAADRRIVFVIPFGDLSLVGTTEQAFEGDPANARCSREERRYLLDSIRRLFPGNPIGDRDIIATFAGVRPLIRSGEKTAGAISRESRIYTGPGGLISITGGKFTTYRRIAERVVNLAVRRLPGRTGTTGRTQHRPLWGAEFEDLDGFLQVAQQAARLHGDRDPALIAHLIRHYGARYREVLALVEQHKELGDRIHPALPHIRAEVLYHIRAELALFLQDVLRRRTDLALGPFRSDDRLIRNVLDVMRTELGWTDRECDRQRQDYLTEIQD